MTKNMGLLVMTKNMYRYYLFINGKQQKLYTNDIIQVFTKTARIINNIDENDYARIQVYDSLEDKFIYDEIVQGSKEIIYNNPK